MSHDVMNAKDAITASLAECYITIDGRRYNFMQAINLEAKMEKNKSRIPILGKTGKANRSTGWTGSGSAKFYYNTSIFRDMLYLFKDSGEDWYFDIQVTNEDPTASVGRQTAILRDCNLDSSIIAQFDADGDYLTEEINFTFEDFEFPEYFDQLEGM